MTTATLREKSFLVSNVSAWVTLANRISLAEDIAWQTVILTLSQE